MFSDFGRMMADLLPRFNKNWFAISFPIDVLTFQYFWWCISSPDVYFSHFFHIWFSENPFLTAWRCSDQSCLLIEFEAILEVPAGGIADPERGGHCFPPEVSIWTESLVWFSTVLCQPGQIPMTRADEDRQVAFLTVLPASLSFKARCFYYVQYCSFTRVFSYHVMSNFIILRSDWHP